MARALGMSCYEHFTLDHERSFYISQDENESGYALNNQKNNDGTIYVIIHVNVRCQTKTVLEDVGAAVIDKNMIPIYAHVRGADLATQNFLLQDPWYVEVYELCF
ncbi:hypothetical protein TSUD_100490 [Trifolium subterraneum]|uniref:Uncharacterized protein n=1 Tax=Trifolium subterraneum TaxID=3900 RepID=A0A2Z6NRW8_TRISU|nr:hypothetical protein TSUD_100490 [Trifolium subterraneum]